MLKLRLVKPQLNKYIVHYYTKAVYNIDTKARSLNKNPIENIRYKTHENVY